MENERLSFDNIDKIPLSEVIPEEVTKDLENRLESLRSKPTIQTKNEKVQTHKQIKVSDFGIPQNLQYLYDKLSSPSISSGDHYRYSHAIEAARFLQEYNIDCSQFHKARYYMDIRTRLYLESTKYRFSSPERQIYKELDNALNTMLGICPDTAKAIKDEQEEENFNTICAVVATLVVGAPILCLIGYYVAWPILQILWAWLMLPFNVEFNGYFSEPSFIGTIGAVCTFGAILFVFIAFFRAIFGK